MSSLDYSGKNERNAENILKLFKFGFVGATGAVLNLGIIYVLTNYFLIWYMISAVIAIECSILWNFCLNTKITFAYRFSNKSDLIMAIFKYHLSSFAGSIINIAALYVLTEFFEIYFITSELLAIILAFGINYFLSVNYVWNKKRNI